MDTIAKAAQVVNRATKSAPKAEPSPPTSTASSARAFFASYEATNDTQRKALEAVYQWVRATYHGEQTGLILLSTGYGVGKTHLAKVAESVLFAAGIPVTFIREIDFFETIKASYGEETKTSELTLFKDWSKTHLILDDFGKTHSGNLDWIQDKYFNLFDRITNAKRSLLITSNLTLKQMSERMGGAAYSRVVGLCKTNVVNLSDLPDYRMKGIIK